MMLTLLRSTISMYTFSLLNFTEKQYEFVTRNWINRATAAALNKYFIANMTEEEMHKLVVKDVEKQHGKAIANAVKESFKEQRENEDGNTK